MSSKVDHFEKEMPLHGILKLRNIEHFKACVRKDSAKKQITIGAQVFMEPCV